MTNIETLAKIVADRRTTKTAAMNGQLIPDDQIVQLLELANWAPNHGNTEPWRFIVYSGNALKEFGLQHAELYKQNTPPEKFVSAKYEKQLHNGDTASHLILVYMQRGGNPNIPVLEEICATAAAVQNILLGAEALGIATIWSTGGNILHPAMKHHLGLPEEDIVIGALYLGYTDEPARPGRRSPAANKAKWIKA